VFLMAAETAAQAEIPAPPPPPAPGSSPEKRALQVPDEGEDELAPDLKRRRACVAALDGVTCAAAAASEPGSGCDADGASFSFQNARAGFLALETTPKFGSFNPPEAGEQPGLDVKPAPPDGEEDDQGPASPASGADEDGGNEKEKSESQSVGVTDKNDDPALTFDHQ
jgi:hypothetical protein